MNSTLLYHAAKRLGVSRKRSSKNGRNWDDVRTEVAAAWPIDATIELEGGDEGEVSAPVGYEA